MEPSKEQGSLFKPLLDLCLEEERESYTNPLTSFEQHKKELEEQLATVEEEFVSRFNRGLTLLNDHFTPKDRL